MKYLTELKDFLNERINSSEAHTDLGSIQTILDGKRDRAFLAISTQKIIDPRPNINGLKFAIDNNLNLLPIKNREEGVAFVIYKNDLKGAQALADFAESKGGYLSDETPEEAEFIGNSLEYHPDDIQNYIIRRYGK